MGLSVQNQTKRAMAKLGANFINLDLTLTGV